MTILVATLLQQCKCMYLMMNAYFLSAVLLVAGCASPYGMDVADAGRLPEPGRQLQVSGPADSRLTDSVVAAMTDRGFRVADPADYLVQIVTSDMPGKAGVFLPYPPSDEERSWLTAPSRSKTTQTRRVTVTLTDMATGAEVYRAFADERYRAGKGGDSDALIEALVSRIAEGGAVSPAAGQEEETT